MLLIVSTRTERERESARKAVGDWEHFSLSVEVRL